VQQASGIHTNADQYPSMKWAVSLAAALEAAPLAASWLDATMSCSQFHPL